MSEIKVLLSWVQQIIIKFLMVESILSAQIYLQLYLGISRCLSASQVHHVFGPLKAALGGCQRFVQNGQTEALENIIKMT